MLQPGDQKVAPPLCSVVLARNTFLNVAALNIQFDERKVQFPESKEAPSLVPIQARGNAFDVSWMLTSQGNPQALPSQAEVGLYGAYYKRVLSWEGRSNAYRGAHPYRLAYAEGEGMPLERTHWTSWWGTHEKEALSGAFVYQGGDLRARLKSDPDQVVPEDFREAVGAGPALFANNKDRGTDVDLVGPGAAYEKWQKTPAYQDWLKATAQVH
jgi:hypothetical protein